MWVSPVFRTVAKSTLVDSLVLRGPWATIVSIAFSEVGMETVVERPAALDVHKEQVTACVRVPGEGRSREQHVAEFPTTVAGLLTLFDWLAAFRVEQVVMEATGVYWKPVWAILEDGFECLLGMLAMSNKFLVARPTSRMPSGCASSPRRACCARASCRPSRSVRCGT